MNTKVLGMTLATTIIAVAMYLLFIAPASEPVYDLVETGINEQSLASIDAVDSVYVVLVIIVFGSWLLTGTLMLHSPRGELSTMASILATYFIMIGTSFCALLLFAHWQPDIAYFWAMPVLFLSYVLGDSAWYIVLLIAVLTITQYRLNTTINVINQNGEMK